MTDAAPDTPTYLNLADAEELSAGDGLRPEEARAIVEARPLHDWSDLRLAGLDQNRINDLKSQGYRLGEPADDVLGEPGSGGHGGGPAGNMGRA